MKKIATLAALTAFAFLGACTSSQNTTAPGAVGETKSGCCASKAESSAAKSAPGAVSGKSDCSTKSGCASKCPATKG